jgi:hypothetical protein
MIIFELLNLVSSLVSYVHHPCAHTWHSLLTWERERERERENWSGLPLKSVIYWFTSCALMMSSC